MRHIDVSLSSTNSLYVTDEETGSAEGWGDLSKVRDLTSLQVFFMVWACIVHRVVTSPM